MSLDDVIEFVTKDNNQALTQLINFLKNSNGDTDYNELQMGTRLLLQLCQAASATILPILDSEFHAILWLTTHIQWLTNRAQEMGGSEGYEDVDYRTILADTLLVLTAITTTIQLSKEQKGV